MTRLIPPLLAGLFVAIASTAPLPAAAATGPSSEQLLREATAHLRRAWQKDPLTARRPFPSIRLVEAGGTPACLSAYFPASAPLVLACPGSGQILLQRNKLAALHGVFGEAAELFVVAYGLGQSLINATPSAAPAATAHAATTGLRAACAAGTLLAALPIPAADRRLVLNNAISAGEQAFPSSAAPQLGTGPQRAYALLSGMGGTPLNCGTASMYRLASGAEPLEAFMATRGTSVGIDKLCKQPPTCPRRLSVGVAGI